MTAVVGVPVLVTGAVTVAPLAGAVKNDVAELSAAEPVCVLAVDDDTLVLRVKPDNIKSLADLARLPFTTKQDLRDNYPFGLFAVPMSSVVRLHASSGTTGRSTVVGYTKRDIDVWSELMARSIRAAGGRPGDLVRPRHRASGILQ